MDNILKLTKLNHKIEPIRIKLNEKTTIKLKEISEKRKDNLGYELKTIKETIRSKDNDFLCKAFFTVGIPKINPEIINDSENSIASCKHKECSILPAIKPEIINKFPNKSREFDINSTTASLCFPSGIKMCYLLEEKKNSKLNCCNKSSNFVNIITNEKGEKFFLYVMQFFKKIENSEFQEIYKIDPIRELMKLKNVIGEEDFDGNEKNISDTNNNFLNKFFNKKEKIKKEIEENLQRNFEICTNFIDNNYVYLPYKICLVSKYSYCNQFEKILEIILKMHLDDKIGNDEINKLLIHLIFEVPSPLVNKKLLFYVPYRINPLEFSEINTENIYCNYSLKSLIDLFSVENIIIIFNLLLMEQKLIFVSNDYRQLSEISQNFMSLLYPIFWLNTYVPIISEGMLKYLGSFMPYVMGVEESLINKAKNYIEEDSNIYLIDINSNQIELSSKKKTKKIDRKILQKTIPELPYEIYEELSTELKHLKKLSEDNKQNINIKIFDNTIKEIFLKIMVMMFGDFKKYVSIIDKIPLFNIDSFLQNRPSKYKNFYTELTQSQLFRHFLLIENTTPKINFDKACFRFSSSINKQIIRRSSSKSFFTKISNNKNEILLSNNISNNTTTITSLQQNISVMKKSEIINNSFSNIEANKDFVKGENDKSFRLNIKEELNYNLLNSEVQLITPYFINETFLRSDILKIEEILIEKFGSRCDKTEILQMNYINYCQKNDKKINKNANNLEYFGLIEDEYLSDRNIILIKDDKDIKKLEFDKITENTFIKKYKISLVDSNCEKKILEKRRSSFNFVSKLSNPLIESNRNNDINLKAISVLKRQSVIDLKLDDIENKNSIKSNANKIQKNCTVEIDQLVENMSNNINETMRIILTSENLPNLNLNQMQKALNTRIGRSLFSSVLFQSKFMEYKLQILAENSFNDLFKLIYLSLSQSEDDYSQFNDIRLITKSCFFYYKKEKDKEVFIFKEISRKQNNFKIWFDKNFWLNWFELDRIEEKNVFSKEDDLNFNILIALADKMNSLGISFVLIEEIIVDYLAKNILTDEELLKEFQKSITKQFMNRNNI